MVTLCIFFLTIPLTQLAAATEKIPLTIEEVGLSETLRSKALFQFDKMLSWTFDAERYGYVLKTPLKPEVFEIKDLNILQFTKNHNYFSDDHPLVSKVSSNPTDLLLTLQLLQEIHLSIKEDKQRELITNEVLAKVLAYRDLPLGQEIPIPHRNNQLITFEVDTLFDLGKGMPAFGLVPQNKGAAAPLLLFRGTDVSILSERGLASILSDLDPKGPGLSVFLQSRAMLHNWLSKVAETHAKAKLIGCSLGGALATYAYLYEYPLISENPLDPSAIFNPPGISKKIFQEWEKIPKEKKAFFEVFVTRGDLIPKIGRLVGNVSEISPSRSLLPIAAHVTLISAEPTYTLNAIDLEGENQSQRFSKDAK